MAGDLKLKAGTVQTLEASGASVSNGAAGVADDQDLDNTTTLAPVWDFELNAGFGTSVAVDKSIDLYLVPKLDGTNEADKDTSTPKFAAGHFAGSFVTVTTGTGARRMTVSGVVLGPYKYVARLVNSAGVTLSATWALKAYPTLNQYT